SGTSFCTTGAMTTAGGGVGGGAGGLARQPRPRAPPAKTIPRLKATARFILRLLTKNHSHEYTSPADRSARLNPVDVSGWERTRSTSCAAGSRRESRCRGCPERFVHG